MSEQPIFKGTPDDWWDQASVITEAEAENRKLGDWYIVKQAHANGSGFSYRMMTPAKPYNADQLVKALNAGKGHPSERVRCLIRTDQQLPAWQTAEFVYADLKKDAYYRGEDGEHIGWVEESTRRLWTRKANGRWNCLHDGRVSVNDQTMATLNPKPAKIIEEED